MGLGKAPQPSAHLCCPLRRMPGALPGKESVMPSSKSPRPLPLFLILALAATPDAAAQQTDQTQTPNVAGAGIVKSLAQEVGAGRGDSMTPLSSEFLIGRDPFRSIQRGRQLFQRKFTAAQGLGP